MVEPEQKKRDVAATSAAAIDTKELLFSVELWRSEGRVERVLGLASSAVLARAIFHAAVAENPGRRITLRRGADIIDDSR